MQLTESQVRQWLLDYAWLGTADAQALEVECILAQDGWQYIDAVADKYAGMAEVPGPEAFDEATKFALSALYECHDEPHLETCPRKR
jgi:hypothetical protein